MNLHLLCPTNRLALLVLAPLLLAATGREVEHRDRAHVQRPVWSPNGKKLSFEANFHEERKKEIELYVGDPFTGQFHRVQPVSYGSITAGFGSVGGGGKVVHELSWAPNGISGFVYSATSDVEDYDLFLASGASYGASNSPLAQHPGADGSAAWSPDGHHIVFTSARTGQGDLYLVEVQDTSAPPRRLTRDPTHSELFASWAPDGTRLVYVGHSETGDNLWMLPSLDGSPVQLTTWTRSQTRPTWSPADDLIAFYANHDDETRFDLYVMDARAGATPRRVVRDVVLNAAGPSWTPDGRHLVYTANDDENYDPIGVVSVADPNRKSVLPLGTVGHGDLDVAKGSDGKVWLAYVAQGRASDSDRTFKRLFVAEIDRLP